MNELVNHLRKHFDPVDLAELDVVVDLLLTESQEIIRIKLVASSCEISEAKPSSDQTPTWTIYLPNEATALSLFRSEANPVDFFMQKKLASSGYIVTTFRVLRAFVSR